MKLAPSSSAPRDHRLAGVWYILVTVLLSLLILADMVMIFCMSAESREESGDRSDAVTDAVVDVVYPDFEERPIEEQRTIFQRVGHFIRKLAHFSEFALLGLLTGLLAGHLSSRIKYFSLWLQWCIPILFGLLYAISDEVHQIFTNRGASPTDVLIDFSGVLCGVVCARLGLLMFRGIIRSLASRREKEVAA